jgi:hypothetical protein
MDTKLSHVRLRVEEETSVCSGDWIGTNVGDHFGTAAVIVPYVFCTCQKIPLQRSATEAERGNHSATNTHLSKLAHLKKALPLNPKTLNPLKLYDSSP